MLGASKRIELRGEEEQWFSDRHVAGGGTGLLFLNPENSKSNQPTRAYLICRVGFVKKGWTLFGLHDFVVD